MVANPLVIPFFGMMLLTILVWFYMYARRLTYILQHKIPAQELTTPEKLAQRVPEHINAPSNNLKNLFELPILFYGICLYQFIQGEASAFVLVSAYCFWIFRILHSLVHCTINQVLLRFVLYVFASMALFTMVVVELFEANLFT